MTVSDVKDDATNETINTIIQSDSNLNITSKAAVSEAHPQNKQTSPADVKGSSVTASKIEKKQHEGKEGKLFGISGNLKLVKRDLKKVYE